MDYLSGSPLDGHEAEDANAQEGDDEEDPVLEAVVCELHLLHRRGVLAPLQLASQLSQRFLQLLARLAVLRRAVQPRQQVLHRDSPSQRLLANRRPEGLDRRGVLLGAAPVGRADLSHPGPRLLLFHF